MSFITVAVRHVAHATPRTRVISLDLAAHDFQFTAGQVVMVGLTGSSLRKPYSIASAPWEVARTGIVQLLAQIDDSGAPDPHLELASPGALIDLEGPFGSFGLRPAFDALPLLFVAGGTGIAPLRSMLMERLARPRVPDIAMVYSARSAEEFGFLSELDSMTQAGRIKLFLTVSRAEGTWSGRRGRIDASLLEQALPSPETCCLLCGPPQLVSDVTQQLVRLGVAEARILTEQF